jgi:biotin carboxylase
MPVLVLGWGLDTISALESLEEPAIIVAAHRKLSRATESQSPPQWRLPVEDHSSAESVLLALERLPPSVRVESVFTQDEFSLVTAAVIARALGVPGPDLAVSRVFRDKVLQKKALRAEGIPVADWRELDGDPDSWAAACDALGYPLVVKPVSGAAADSTELVRSAGEVRSILGELVRRRPGRRMMAETFVPGPELTIDGVVVDRDITFLGVEHYLRNVLASRDGTGFGATLDDPVRGGDLYGKAAAFAHNAISALGLRTGVFHMEVFEGPSGFTFGECAARVGGLYITRAYRWKFGVDLHVESLRLALLGPDRYTAPQIARRADGVAWASLGCRPGLVEYAPSAEEIQSLPGVVDAGVYIKKGDVAPDLRINSQQRAGQVLVSALDEESATSQLKKVCEYFSARCDITDIASSDHS